MIVTEEQRREAHAFYKEALDLLNESGVRYMLGGAFAMFHYTEIYRDTKDLDIFCKPSDYPKILKTFADKGYKTDLYDVRWLAKVYKGEYFIDIIFDTVNNICRVDDSWLGYAIKARFVGVDVHLLAPEELVWCKLYVMNRERYDGADVNHIWLKTGKILTGSVCSFTWILTGIFYYRIFSCSSFVILRNSTRSFQNGCLMN